MSSYNDQSQLSYIYTSFTLVAPWFWFLYYKGFLDYPHTHHESTFWHFLSVCGFPPYNYIIYVDNPCCPFTPCVRVHAYPVFVCTSGCLKHLCPYPPDRLLHAAPSLLYQGVSFQKGFCWVSCGSLGVVVSI